MKVGEIELTPLVDGACWLPTAFYQGIDWERHGNLLAADGRIHIPIGCYLVRTGDRVVLLDAGMGPRETAWGRGGALLHELAAVGVSPGDIDTVLCTHLHTDHAGWLWRDGAPGFPHATVRFGAGDWQQFVTEADDDDHVRVAVEALAEADRIELLDGDSVAIAPGVTARFTPGHTLGHYGLVIASGTDRVYVLGDAVECPLQVAEPELFVISDVDPALARRTREAVWAELEGTDALVGAAHFPDLQFGRILPGEGRRYWS